MNSISQPSQFMFTSYQSSLKPVFVDQLPGRIFQLFADLDHRHSGLDPTLDVLPCLPMSLSSLNKN